MVRDGGVGSGGTALDWVWTRDPSTRIDDLLDRNAQCLLHISGT